MTEACYFHENTCIIDYSAAYITNAHQLVDSEAFTEFLNRYVVYLSEHHRDLYRFLIKDHPDQESIVKDLKSVLNLLLIMNFDQVDVPYVKLPHVFLEIVEEGYHYWRSLQRYSLLHASRSSSYRIDAFIDADNEINSIALQFYRAIQEKVQGGYSNVYRQLQAGTNASLLLESYAWPIPEGYEVLKDIPFISMVMLRTPLLLHPKSSKRTNKFIDADHNPIEDFSGQKNEWICYPASVGEMLIYCYFHRSCITSAVSCSNLFALARPKDCIGKKPDAILLFGNKDGTKDTVFYEDKDAGMWVGKVSDAPEIDYFGYTKKAILTLHNLAMMEKGWLPIHGAMVNLYLKDGTKKGLLFMGDSGAGKSETIEALSIAGKDLIDHQETVFDDMGTLHLDEHGEVRAEGTEIGAFVRLDDLDRGTAYKDLDRSIFFNPEKANARVVLPAAPYSAITEEHPIDCFLYANNYTDKRGLEWLDGSVAETEKPFVEGKRFALGTTQENGISTTYFANPFGPMQRQEECQPIIDKMFTAMKEQNIPIGEIYTCLGLPGKGDHGIEKAAEALLDFVIHGREES